MFLLLSFMLFLQQNQRTREWKHLPGDGVVDVAKTLYTHVSKCKNDKTKQGGQQGSGKIHILGNK
jgi:hypothetical protein